MKKIIKAIDMKDGQVGVIVKTGLEVDPNIGHKIKREGTSLIDFFSMYTWDSFFSASKRDHFHFCEVEIDEAIDFAKAQVFDPPVLLEVSDAPDFPKERTYKELVFLVYPEFDVPIRTTESSIDAPVSGWIYAREIKEDAFEEFYKKENPLMKHGTFKEEFRKVWEAGVKHGKGSKE